MPVATKRFRSAMGAVGVLNLAYFIVELAVATAIGSVSLFADSIDFLEDACVSFVIVAAFGWTAQNRARLGMALAAILLIPAIAVIWTAVRKFVDPITPEPSVLSLTAFGALIINLVSAFLVAPFKQHHGSLSRAAFLSARNDALANIAIIAAGFVTAFMWRSVWPDLAVGLAIAVMNMDAAREVWSVAREERRSLNQGA